VSVRSYLTNLGLNSRLIATSIIAKKKLYFRAEKTKTALSDGSDIFASYKVGNCFCLTKKLMEGTVMEPGDYFSLLGLAQLTGHGLYRFSR
jgi:hypothetical protein